MALLTVLTAIYSGSLGYARARRQEASLRAVPPPRRRAHATTTKYMCVYGRTLARRLALYYIYICTGTRWKKKEKLYLRQIYTSRIIAAAAAEVFSVARGITKGRLNNIIAPVS